MSLSHISVSMRVGGVVRKHRHTIVTIDGVGTSNWIDWTLKHTTHYFTLQIAVTD
jgi:hypothetical protein